MSELHSTITYLLADGTKAEIQYIESGFYGLAEDKQGNLVESERAGLKEVVEELEANV